jgi:hypothetical protein
LQAPSQRSHAKIGTVRYGDEPERVDGESMHNGEAVHSIKTNSIKRRL